MSRINIYDIYADVCLPRHNEVSQLASQLSMNGFNLSSTVAAVGTGWTQLHAIRLTQALTLIAICCHAVLYIGYVQHCVTDSGSVLLHFNVSYTVGYGLAVLLLCICVRLVADTY